MESQKEFGRREFIGAAAAALFAGVTITILGCNDDKGTGSGTEPGDMAGEISKNHGHKAVITKAQLDAGGAVTLQIQGEASHNHTVSLAAEQMAALKQPNGMVTVLSTAGGDGHTHEVMFM